MQGALAENYRVYLERGFTARRDRNPAYSLRAYARFLGISPSLLSEVMSRKAGLSAVSANRIAERLALTPLQKERFTQLVASEHGRGKRAKVRAREALINPRTALPQITLDVFAIISDWHHFALLELALTRGFRLDFEWIAKRLGISSMQAREGIERLERQGLLSHSGGRILPTSGSAVKSNHPNEALRKYHRQLLEKALDAIESQPMDRRELGAMIFAIDPSDLPSLRRDIAQFRAIISRKYGATTGKPRGEVYALCTPLFSLTDPRHSGELP